MYYKLLSFTNVKQRYVPCLGQVPHFSDSLDPGTHKVTWLHLCLAIPLLVNVLKHWLKCISRLTTSISYATGVKKVSQNTLKRGFLRAVWNHVVGLMDPGSLSLGHAPPPHIDLKNGRNSWPQFCLLFTVSFVRFYFHSSQSNGI